MKLGVTDGRKIHQHHAAISFLQRNRSVDSGGSSPCATLGTEESKDACFACAATSPRAVRTEARQSFEKGFGAGAVIQILSSSGAHAGHNGGGLQHRSVSKNCKLQGVRLDEFYGPDRWLRILGRNVDDNDLCAQILNLPQDGIRRSGGKSDIAEYCPAQTRSLYTALQLQ